MCGGEGYYELPVNFTDFLFIVHAIFLFHVYIVSFGYKERPRTFGSVAMGSAVLFVFLFVCPDFSYIPQGLE